MLDSFLLEASSAPRPMAAIAVRQATQGLHLPRRCHTKTQGPCPSQWMLEIPSLATCCIVLTMSSKSEGMEQLAKRTMMKKRGRGRQVQQGVRVPMTIWSGCKASLGGSDLINGG